MAHKPSIVGSIVERKPSSSVSIPKLSSSGKTGFPTVQHRSKSAFARNREDLRKSGIPRLHTVPAIAPSSKQSSRHSSSPPPSSVDWRDQVSRENEERVAGMTEEEREQERREIVERFGANVGDILKRARLARDKQHVQKEVPQPMQLEPDSDQVVEGYLCHCFFWDFSLRKLLFLRFYPSNIRRAKASSC